MNNGDEKSPLNLAHKLNISDTGHTFENFEKKYGTFKAYQAFKEFAEGKGPRLLLCHGGVGNGKTYLLEALALYWYSKGIYCRVVTMSSFLRLLKNTMRQHNPIPTYDQILDNYCQAEHLLVDDIGMGMLDTQWETSILEELVVNRYHNRLWTAMTTNKELDNLPVKVVSRFYEDGIGIVVHNQGKDYRIKQNGETK